MANRLSAPARKKNSAPGFSLSSCSSVLAGIGIAGSPDLDVRKPGNGDCLQRPSGRHAQTGIRIQDSGLLFHVGTAAGNEQNLVQPKGGIGIFCRSRWPMWIGLKVPPMIPTRLTPVFSVFCSGNLSGGVQSFYAPCFPYTARFFFRLPGRAGTWVRSASMAPS